MSTPTIVRSMSTVCSNATSQDVVLDTWPPELNICWTQIAALDRSGTVTTLEIGLKRAGEFYIINAETPGAAARSANMVGEVTAPGDFVPCARFLAATSGHVLELYAMGMIVD